jgi:hypothetical protein
MIPGTILLIEKEILAVSVDDDCHNWCEYGITGSDLPAGDSRGLTVILLECYSEIRSFVPPFLIDYLPGQQLVNDFLWRCWREHKDIFQQHLTGFSDVILFPLRQSGDDFYDVLWIHFYLNFLKSVNKETPVPSWTGERLELIRWLENQKWEKELSLVTSH